MTIIVVTKEKCAVNTEDIVLCETNADGCVMVVIRGGRNKKNTVFQFSTKEGSEEFLDKLDLLYYRPRSHEKK